jgi:ADP-ribosylglycohydrolase
MECLREELWPLSAKHAGEVERYFYKYPNAGYGFRFFHWASAGRREPYNSFGDGSAMRAPAIGWAFDTLDAVLAEAARSAE